MIRNFFSRLMYGRYGNDQLNIFLFVIFWLLWIAEMIVRNQTADAILSGVSTLLALILLFRIMSRNYRPPPGGKRRLSEGGRAGDPLVQASALSGQGQGSSLLQVPHLLPDAAGAQGQGQNLHHLPQLRHSLSGKDLNLR